MNEFDTKELIEFFEDPKTFVDLVEEMDSRKANEQVAYALKNSGQEILANSEMNPDRLSAQDVGLLYLLSQVFEKPFEPQTA